MPMSMLICDVASAPLGCRSRWVWRGVRREVLLLFLESCLHALPPPLLPVRGVCVVYLCSRIGAIRLVAGACCVVALRLFQNL